MFQPTPSQVQSNPSAVFSQLREAFQYIAGRIEKGEPVTLVLIAGGRAVTLDVKNEAVEAREQPAGVVDAGTDYNSLRAFTTNVFRFDVNEAQRDISRHDVELGIQRKSTLPNPLVRKSSGHNWVLAEDCSVAVADMVITARAGFETDFASIPRLFWPLMDSTEVGIVPPTVHDLIYRAGGRLPSGDVTPAGMTFDRARADDVFDDLMARSPGVRTWRRKVAYHAVRLCGGSSWRGADG